MKFFQGFFVFFRGLGAMTNYPLSVAFMTVPWLVGLTSFLVLYSQFFPEGQFLDTWFQSYLGILPSVIKLTLLKFLKQVLWLLVTLSFFFVSYLISVVVSAPMISLMVERYLRYMGFYEEPENGGFVTSSLFAFKMARVAILRLIFFGFLTVFAWVLSAFMGFFFVVPLVAFFIMSLDFYDFTLEAKGFHFFHRMNFASRRFFLVSGSGFFTFLLAFIPGALLLAYPVLCLGAADLIKKEQKESFE